MFTASLPLQPPCVISYWDCGFLYRYSKLQRNAYTGILDAMSISVGSGRNGVQGATDCCDVFLLAIPHLNVFIYFGDDLLGACAETSEKSGYRRF